MAHLCSLPAEIILEILECLPIASRASLCRTCKRLQCHVESVLYQSVRFAFVEKHIPRDWPRLLVDHPMNFCFRTLYERPDLAARVRSVNLVSEVPSFELGRAPPVVVPVEILPIWRGAAGELEIPEQEVNNKLQDDIGKGEVHAMTAVFLSRLHNLEVLKLDFSVICRSSIFGPLMRLFAVSKGAKDCAFLHLGRLKEVHVRNNLDCRIFRVDYTSTDAVLSFFHFPCVETMEIVLEESDTISQPLDVAELPSLKRLRITNCGAGNEILACLLARTPNLESFEFFFAQNLEPIKADEEYAYGDYNEWQAFESALNVVSGTLKSLTVSVDCAYIHDYPPDSMDEDWVGGIWERRGSVTSLLSFTRLERLEIPIFVLLGWEPQFPKKRLRDVLPRGLRELCLRDDLITTEEHYPWAPFNSDVIGSPGTNGFRPDPSPVIQQLEDYLSPRSETDMDEHPAPSLEVLCLKVHKHCVWPSVYLKTLENISRGARVTCTLRRRMEKYWSDSMGPLDEVQEMIIYDPKDSTRLSDAATESQASEYESRRFDERSRNFDQNC